MKETITLTVGVAVLLISQTVNAQISSTKHNFSSLTWAPTENKMCGVCHATHNARSEPSAPLWNHQSTSVASYTMYSSPTFNGTISSPSASSKLCLSCHDGTVAIDNFGNTPPTPSISGFIPAGSRIGGVSGSDMSKDHPISFVYNTGLANTDGGLKDPMSASSGLGRTINSDMLYDNKMECASCHDVHNKFKQNHLLKLSNTNSQLCLTCHNK
jgi:predicted CXXCH cytochrome family protein